MSEKPVFLLADADALRRQRWDGTDGEWLVLLVPTTGERTAIHLYDGPAAAGAWLPDLVRATPAALIVPQAAIALPRRHPAPSPGRHPAPAPAPGRPSAPPPGPHRTPLPVGPLPVSVGASLVRGLVLALLDGTVSLEATHVAAHLVDLVATLVCEATAPERPTAGRNLLEEIRWQVNDRLDDVTLSPGTIAAHGYISVRYLHKLFRDEGTTVGRWVVRRRLEEACRELAGPGRAGRTISVTAKRWGFANAAHFSRVFHAAYGRAPRDWRDTRAALVARSDTAPRDTPPVQPAPGAQPASGGHALSARQGAPGVNWAAPSVRSVAPNSTHPAGTGLRQDEEEAW
ncbi:helix-turn-helix transcriptional regulator [Streptomyces sp. NPDC007084]|uniref:helix-turn-helix transcriptional regulator n=1 Tax=Streptomyces sp. NPDC007084 TaxID=3154313 RepID=UPI0034526527